MEDIPRLIYLSIFTIAFGFGLSIYKYNKSLWILLGLMALGLLTEYIVEFNKHLENKVNENVIYNIYVPLEYIFYTSFFYFINSDSLVKKSIKTSIPIFIIIVFTILNISNTNSNELQSYIYMLGGVLTIFLSIWSLFLIKPIKNIKFIEHPLFWFCTGFIIFYSCILPFTFIQNHLENIDSKTLKKVSNIIQKGANIILYAIIIIGFICSNRMQKHSSFQ